MFPKIRAVIADDEPILRAHLKITLEAAWPELDIVGQAADGEEALALIDAFDPQVVFLDINMPGTDGLEVSKILSERDQAPYVVFVTAYDEHAVVAFENQAIDYLLKPLDNVRLEKTISRLQKMLQETASAPDQKQQIKDLFEELVEVSQPAQPANYLKWIKANRNNELHLVDVARVDYFIADNKYTEITAQQNKYLIKTPISTLEEELDPDVFWRIHRNCIVRVEQIQHVTKDELGHVYAHLKDGAQKLAVSRKYHNLFKQM